MEHCGPRVMVESTGSTSLPNRKKWQRRVTVEQRHRLPQRVIVAQKPVAEVPVLVVVKAAAVEVALVASEKC